MAELAIPLFQKGKLSQKKSQGVYMNLCNPGTVKRLMEEAGITFRKEYGQNFLIDASVPERISELCADDAESMILEIGPGIGCLTQELAARYRRVVAVEIDRGLIPVLAGTLSECDNVTVIEGDVMKTDLAALVQTYSDGLPVSVCANLPYYITTPILMRLMESGVPFRTVTVMVQNEVAARLCAGAGDSDYGAITAVLGYYGTVQRLFRVPAGAFMPAPKVDSAVIRIDLYPEPKYRPKNEKLFFGLIRAAFEMRRKTLVNAVSAKFPQYGKEKILAALEQMGQPATVRGERLSTGDFVRLADILSEKER